MAVFFFFFFELIYEKFDDSLFLFKKRWKGDLLILTFSGFFIFYFLFFAHNNSLGTKIKILELDTWHNIKVQLKSKFNLDSNCFFNQNKTQESCNLTSIF